MANQPKSTFECKNCGRIPGSAESIQTIDPCIEPIIEALNKAGIGTYWSCCGHDQCPGYIALLDGRHIAIFKSHKLHHAAMFGKSNDDIAQMGKDRQAGQEGRKV